MEGKQLALDVCIRSNLFSYTVYARERQLIRFSVSESGGGDNELLDWFRSDEWLKRSYDQVEILWSGDRYSLVPKELAESGNAAALARHSFRTAHQEQLRYDAVDAEKQLLYPVQESLYYTVRNRFPNATHRHLSSRLLSWYLDGTLENEALVILHDKYLEFYLAEHGRLQVMQSFPFSNDTEAAYHVLNAMERLQINRENATIHLLGTSSQSPVFQLLDTYIRKVKIVRVPVPEALKPYPEHMPLLLNLL